MSLGRRRQVEPELWLSYREIPKGPGHVFYQKLNQLLEEHGFDRFVEDLCAPYYHDRLGRPSIPPGVYFRMVFVGYFEGLDSHRGIAWRCADSLSLREFLGYTLTQSTPDHSSLSRIRDRLPAEVHVEVFRWVLRRVEEAGLLSGRSVGVDSTTLEANAAMKSIVRRDTGQDYQQYLQQLMESESQAESPSSPPSAPESQSSPRSDSDASLQEEPSLPEAEKAPDNKEKPPPSARERRRFDRRRRGKRVSNREWTSPTDPDSRIARMKDGTTHLAYKAEHVVDLETEALVAAEVYHADEADTATLVDSVVEAQTHLNESGIEKRIEEVAADRGYHGNETLALAESVGLRTYVSERECRGRRRWRGKPEEQQRAFYHNRRRVRSGKGRRLNRLRTERVERTFAHVCDTGGQRRQWSRGLEKVRKGYLLAAAGYNLGLILRKVFGLVKPRGLAGAWRRFLRYLDGLLCHVKSVIVWKRPFPCRVVFALFV